MGFLDWLTGKRSEALPDKGDGAKADTSSPRSREQESRLAELEQAFRREPGNVKVLEELGHLALELGHLDKAQRVFRARLLQRFVTEAPMSKEAYRGAPDWRFHAGAPMTKADVFFVLGEIHHRLGEGAKAINMLERALQTDPRHAGAQSLLSELRK